MPDGLYERARQACAQRRLTFKALVIDAVERALAEEAGDFRLRDASAGYAAGEPVSSERIDRAIDEGREPDATA